MRGSLPCPLRLSAEFRFPPAGGLAKDVRTEPTTRCAMKEICADQNDDEIIQFEVSDVFLESAAGDGRDNTNAVTHGVCTAVDFCPGP